MSFKDDGWKGNALYIGFHVNSFVGRFSFENVDCCPTKDVVGTFDVIEGTFAVVKIIVTNDVIILLIGGPSNLTLLLAGDFCTFDFLTGEELFVLRNSVEERISSNSV